MDVKLYDFQLPEQLIAQTPLLERTDSRLLHLHLDDGGIDHLRFTDLSRLLQSGDLLILNDSRVIPARLFGVKEDTGAKIEFLLLSQQNDHRWEVLIKPSKKVKLGTTISFGEGKLIATVHEQTEVAGGWIVSFQYEGIFQEILDQLGSMPLPPYIREQLDDKERYQTVFAKHHGSAAAPTAGLHFSTEMLSKLEKQGVKIGYVTLHVGLGTFRPVNVDRIEDHHMHAEFYQISQETVDLINETKEKGHRVIPVGTTSLRTIESVAQKHGTMITSSGWTDIFIYPGYEFMVTDGLLTNFHLPKSSLMMLVSALAGRERIMGAYKEAIREEYRFFSFGDAMLIM